MKPYSRFIVFCCFVAALFTGCAKGSNEIKIGAVAPITGEAATFGDSTKKGASLAAEEWNAKGGIDGRQIRLVVADDKGDPAEGATVFTKLIEQDKVKAIIGTVMSKVCLAGAPIAQAAKVPMITPTATNEKVTQVGDYIFRACFIDPFQGTVGAKFAKEELKAGTAACIFDAGNDYAKGLSENFKKAFESMGGKVSAYEGHASGTTDFKAQLTKILASKPDVIYCSDYYNDDALIAKQARELGFTGPFVGGDGWDSADLVKIGGEAVNNCFFTNHYAPDATTEAVVTFVKNYQAKYNATPDALAALAYDAANILFSAIDKAGSTDNAKIRDALMATDLAVVSGQVKFDANRNPIKSAVVIEIKGGKPTYRATVNP